MKNYSLKSDHHPDCDLGFKQSQIRRSFGSSSEAMNYVEKATESLVFAYLFVNRNLKSTPLKEFMNDFEKKTLLACLCISRDNQKDAAALLGIKPTTLFEKMRKHGINGR